MPPRLTSALFLTLASTLSCAQSAPPPAPPTPTSTIASITIHAADFPDPVSISLAQSHPLDIPAAFDSIAISARGRHSTFSTSTPQIRPPAPPHGFIRDPSGYFYLIVNRDRTFLFFIGHSFTSSPGSVLVIGFAPDGTAGIALNLRTFRLLEFASAAVHPAIIGRRSSSAIISGSKSATTPYAATYDPYAVYRLPSRGDDHADYSIADSIHYNDLHYCWAGPESSTDFAVLFNIQGHAKPFPVPASQAAIVLQKYSQ
jgi:hypothetical protein